MINTYDQRQFELMLNKIECYKKKQLTLKQLIQNLEALWHALEDDHKLFIKLFLTHWETLEIECASMLCQNERQPNSEEKNIIDTTISDLIILIKTYLNQPDQLTKLERINPTQTLCAFILFLQEWNKKETRSDIENLIKRLQLTADAISNDLTLWKDWQKITSGLNNQNNTPRILDNKTALQAILSFINVLQIHNLAGIAVNIRLALQTPHGKNLWAQSFDKMAQSPIGFFPKQCWLMAPK